MKFDQQNTIALANNHDYSSALMDLATLISNNVNQGPIINQLRGKNCISGDDAVRNINPTPKTVDVIFATTSNKTIYTEFKFKVTSINSIDRIKQEINDKINDSRIFLGPPYKVFVLLSKDNKGNQIKNRLAKRLLPIFGNNCVLFPQQFVDNFF